MPQLNPTPWFMTLVFAWLIFLTFIPYKISNNAFPDDMKVISTKSLKAKIWNWPWY